MAEAIEESVPFAHLHEDMKTLRRRIKPKRGQETVITDPYILGLLPSKDTSASLAKLYFDRFETTYRILHGPRFWKNFEKLWDEQAEPNIAFTVILLLVILIARTIAPEELLTYVGSSLSTSEPAAVIHAGKIWLARQSKKHLKIESFQIQILLYVASQVNSEQLKQSWNTAGMLVRSAMSVGLHREPSLLGSKISTYNQEMRRRLWLTIVELDLQASVDRGMQASLTGIPWDSRSPGNIDDAEINEETHQLPPSRSSFQYTSSSYSNLSQKSVRLRTEINSILNNPGYILSHNQVLDFEDELVKLLEDVPEWEISSSPNSNSSAPRSSKLVLEIQLRQYLLLIHSHYLRQSNIGSRGRYSAVACLNSAVSILRGYKELGSSGFSAYSLLSCGVLRAALSICQTIYSSPKILGKKISHPTSRNRLLIFSTGESFPSDSDATFLQSMNEALDLLQRNVTRIGSGFKEYWFASAAYTLLQLRSSTDKQLRKERQRAAWEKVGMLYYRVLAARKDLTAESSAAGVETVNFQISIELAMANPI
jgi:hypothetical protein